VETYAGIDLHSSNNYIGVIDSQARRLYTKRHDNRLDCILRALDPFKKTLAGVVVESTYNWYWVVDGLQDNGYTVHLANPAAIQQYEGLKFTDDKWDALWLANMLRLNILPEGYIYPKADRAVRDLLRRRMMFVGQRTAQILSLQSMITRNRGLNFSGAVVKNIMDFFVDKLFDSPHLRFTAKKNLAVIRFLGEAIKDIEAEVKSQAKLKKEFELLLTMTGVGDILGMTIMMEVGDISRFEAVGNYSSYCRCVESKRLSNGKLKGKNNKKNGNKYLSWAYIEAANFSRRFCPMAKKFYQRKLAKSNKVLATKALANKLSKASYFIMRDQVPYDPEKLFK
jgi:transposase